METLFGPHIDHSIPADGIEEVEVHANTGDIHVRGGRPDTIHISSRSDSEDGIGVQRDGARLVIRTAPNNGSNDDDIDITVPGGTRVSANTVQSDIVVMNTEAGVNLHSVHGDIHLDGAGGEGAEITLESVDGDLTVVHVTGEIRLSTTSGDVNLSDATGVLTVQSTNGDVTINRTELRRFHVDSTNGDIRVESPLSHGEHYFARSTNGDVVLTVPAGAGFTAQMRTQNGDVKCSLPHEVINGSKRNRQIRVGGGGATVELETQNGDVSISQGAGGGLFRQAEHRGNAGRSTDWQPIPPIPPIPPTPPMPSMPSMHPAPDFAPPPFEPAPHVSAPNGDDLPDTGGEGEAPDGETTISILARLESGELTVDEAMERLEALR